MPEDMRSSFNSARASRVYFRDIAWRSAGTGGTAMHPGAFFRAPPVTCRVCPSAFWRGSAGWTTSGRCYDDEFFRPSYSSQACQPRPALIQSQRVPPIQSQRVHPARSAALQWAVTDVATVESVPDLATGKTRNVT